MMVGYHKPARKRAREAEWFDPSGKRFIRTGDIGRFDEDGFLILLDPPQGHDHLRRLQHLPSDLEAALRETPAVAGRRVVECPPPRWGGNAAGGPSSCAARVTPTKPRRCASGSTRVSARRSGWPHCTSSTNCRAASVKGA